MKESIIERKDRKNRERKTKRKKAKVLIITTVELQMHSTKEQTQRQKQIIRKHEMQKFYVNRYKLLLRDIALMTKE